MKSETAARLSLVATLGLLAGCGASRDGAGGAPQSQVVVYSSQDREFAEPMLKAYEKQSGVAVLPKFDVESTKTVGLTNDSSPRRRGRGATCSGTTRSSTRSGSRSKGLLAPFQPSHAGDLPDDVQGQGRHLVRLRRPRPHPARQHQAVPEADRPKGIKDLLDPKWKGKIGIAKPLFGTTATHAACLFAAWGDDKAKELLPGPEGQRVQVLSGNKQVATAVGSGQIAFGLTDTDDAMGEVDAGSPVAIIYPDRKPDELGTLFIPNTLAIIKGAPSPRGRPGPGRSPAQPRGRGRAGQRPERPDPAPEDHRGLGAGRDAQDRPRDGGRLRSGGQGLEQGRRLPGRRVRRLNLMNESCLVARGLRPDLGRLRRWSRARRRPGTSRPTRPARSPRDSATRSALGGRQGRREPRPLPEGQERRRHVQRHLGRGDEPSRISTSA